MRLILREAVNNLGAAGEVVRVKPGYGRNFLIPQGLAYVATDSNMRRMEEERQLLDEKAKHDFLEAKRRASQLDGMALSFVVQAGEEGKLFGSVTSKDIGEEAQSKGLDFDLDRRSVALPEPIKAVGDYTVPIRLHPDVEVEILVAVTADES
ncbi:MAG: 50S ribosomal protein L9 [Longimicrobiales bacterium]